MNVYILYYFIYLHFLDFRSREQCLSNIYDENMFVSKTSLIRKLMLNHINGFIHRYVNCHKHLQIIDKNGCNILSWNGKSNDQMTTTGNMFLSFSQATFNIKKRNFLYKRQHYVRPVRIMVKCLYSYSSTSSYFYIPLVPVCQFKLEGTSVEKHL